MHVAIIMDGNGRWAEGRGKERFEGHLQGVESVRTAIKSAQKFGVRYLTLYAFSTENWGRPAEEVEALMDLFCTCVVNETPELIAEGVRVRIIGDKEGLSTEVRMHLDKIERDTEGGETLTLLLALNYSSREEITRAARLWNAHPDTTFEAHLYTNGIPDPDLVIRTSGEQRLSNFLLWQAAYAEFYFTPVLWPDFGEAEFKTALDAYASRDRRYGKITNQ